MKSEKLWCAFGTILISRLRRHLNYSLLTINSSLPTVGRAGTPGGTRTPDLLLRSVGKGVFLVLKRPFDALWAGNWGGDFPFVIRCPHRFFSFWVRIWVKNKRLVTPNCNQAQWYIWAYILPRSPHGISYYRATETNKTNRTNKNSALTIAYQTVP